MPRFKTPDYGLKMIPVDFDQQVIPGRFEHALCGSLASTCNASSR